MYTCLYGNAFNDPQRKKKCMKANFKMLLNSANAWLKLRIFFFNPVGHSNFQWPFDGQVHAMDHHRVRGSSPGKFEKKNGYLNGANLDISGIFSSTFSP